MSPSNDSQSSALYQKSLDGDSILCSSDDRSAQQSLHGDFEEFDIESQNLVQEPGIASKLGQSVKGAAARTGSRLGNLHQFCTGPVLNVLTKILICVLYLLIGAAGLFVIWFILIGFTIVMTKFAMAAVSVWEKTGAL